MRSRADFFSSAPSTACSTRDVTIDEDMKFVVSDRVNLRGVVP